MQGDEQVARASQLARGLKQRRRGRPLDMQPSRGPHSSRVDRNPKERVATARLEVARASQLARGLKLDRWAAEDPEFEVARASQLARGLKHHVHRRGAGDEKSRGPHSSRVD